MKKTVIVTGGCGGLSMEFVKSHLESGDKVYAYDLKLTPDFEKLMKVNDNLTINYYGIKLLKAKIF